MTPEEIADELERIIQRAVSGMAGDFGKAEREALDALLAELSRLTTTPDGRIKPTKANLSVRQRLRDLVNRVLFGASFASGVDRLNQAIEDSIKIMTEYLSQYSTFRESGALEVLTQSAIETVERAFSENGLFGPVGERIDGLLNDAIISGSTVRDLVASLRDYFDTNPMANLSRINFQTVATDLVGQFHRAYFKAAGDRVGLQWYRYVGGRIDSTRAFCKERTGKYFHRSEVEAWSDLNWEGKIDGTNAETIFTFAGGYNCRHTLVPVLAKVVPAEDRARIL